MTNKKRFGYFAAAFLLAVATLESIEPGRAEDIRLNALNIPAVVSGSSGAESVELEAMMVRPDDRLPHPLVVLNHGSPRSSDNHPAMTPYSLTALRGVVGSPWRSCAAVWSLRGRMGRNPSFLFQPISAN
jgi:hypothetical protein